MPAREPRAVVLGAAGRPGAGQSTLPTLPDTPVLPSRRGRTPRAIWGLGRRNLHSRRGHRAEKAARPPTEQA